MKFSIIGPSGYIANRHLSAIKRIQKSNIYSYLDIVESAFEGNTTQTKFFKNQNDFFQDLSKNPVDYLIICSPNNLHFHQILESIKLDIKVICEKPICINIDDLNFLNELDPQKKDLIYSIMQLRLHPVASLIHELVRKGGSKKYATVKYVSRRDELYKKSWKVKREFSGGILFNLGIHYFDLILNAWSQPLNTKIEVLTNTTAKGKTINGDLELEWLFSIDEKYLKDGQDTFREFKIDEQNINFSNVAEDLHYLNYLEIINNQKFGFKEMYNVHQYISNLYNNE